VTEGVTVRDLRYLRSEPFKFVFNLLRNFV